MSIISQIIDDLTDDTKKLSATFLKIKVLATRINNLKLLTWVNNELEGYLGKELPEYRVLREQQLIGTLTNSVRTYNRQPIGIQHLTSEQQKEISTVKIKEGITQIETEASRAIEKDKIHACMIPPESLPMLSEPYNRGKGHYAFIDAYIMINPSIFPALLTTIKSKLLDLMLEIEKEIPQEEIEKLFSKKEIKEKTNEVINQYLIQNSNIFVSNQESTQNITVEAQDS